MEAADNSSSMSVAGTSSDSNESMGTCPLGKAKRMRMESASKVWDKEERNEEEDCAERDCSKAVSLRHEDSDEMEGTEVRQDVAPKSNKVSRYCFIRKRH